MGRNYSGMALAICAFFLCGCAARSVTPMRMAQPGDDQLNCSALQQQLTANAAAASDFLRKDKDVEHANIAKNVGGVIPGLGLFLTASTDLSNAEQIQARAILDRNERLTLLSKNRGCTE